MKILRDSWVGFVCALLVWGFVTRVLMSSCSSTTCRGTYSDACRQNLQDFLAKHAFRSVPQAAATDASPVREMFQGSYRGSRPFTVTILKYAEDKSGIRVAVDYEFRGWARSVNASVAKVDEFSDALFQMLQDCQMQSLKGHS